MKRYAALFLVLIILMFTLPTRAQDTDATDEPVSTQEVAVTEEVAVTIEPTSELASATPLPTATALPSATPLPTATAITGGGTGDDGNGSGDTDSGSGLSDPTYLVVIAVLIVILAFGAVDRWTNYKLSKAAISQVPPEWLPVIQKGMDTAQKVGYERAGAVVKQTPATWDDNLLDEQMKSAGWEFYIGTDGLQHARKMTPATGTPAS